MKLEILIERKREKGMTNEELAERSGVPFSTVAKIMAGRTRDPKFETVSALAHILGCSLSELDDTSPSLRVLPSMSERTLLERYRALDKFGRRAVDAVAGIELERLEGDEEDAEPVLLREYVSPAAAGIAAPCEGEDYVLVPCPDAPKGAEFAVRIQGDSMEPFIADGSRVYVSRKSEVRDGDVGIFFADGGMVCKQYCEDGYGNIYLLSLNRERTDADLRFMASSGQTVYCFGKVLMQKVPLPRM